ncbi:hypothetical protein [Ammoniphilus sp. YIM 78166]|uniref:hypothetical protein n=1 Tax=Ammoniphilus sp. YIM 78166 TaxID=1644106 RepID=UPI00107002F6|nr:hypothetical protein [Ammoniphilus sp. YIM 78166]
MFKKLLVFFVAFALVLSPGGLFDHQEADAKKSYKSGTKSFTPTKNDSNMNSTTNKPATNNPATNTPAAAKPASSGGFMKGLLFGGLAGMLLGSMFGEGMLGAIFGLLINILVIAAVIFLVRKIYVYFKNQRNPRDIQDSRR